jgi:tetrachlorobenzoquinone reductase
VTDTFEVRIKVATWETPDIVSYELRSMDASPLPPFTAGAHINLHLSNGLVRSYSLLNEQTERHRYVIAVQKDRATRGGSKWIHENFRVGDVIRIGRPQNNFPLDETAEKSVLIAGGIGITPIMSMIARLSALRRDWELIYCARTRSAAAFVDTLADNVRLNFDAEPGGQMLDIAAVVAAAPPGAHFYCCGPSPMLSAFQSATAHLDPGRVHLEYFTNTTPAAVEGGFKVVLAKSNRELEVLPGKTILDTLVDAGLDIPYSCMEGVCASCETKVLEGIPDHRDAVLSDKERAEGKTMMICCSGSKTERLVLDL